jgi:hypothetical protein
MLLTDDDPSEPFLQESETASKRDENFEKSSRYTRPATLMQYLSSRSRTTTHCIVFAATSLLWSSIFLFMLLYTPSSSSTHTHHNFIEDPQHPNLYGNFPSRSRFHMCGYSTAEAKTLGCEYDILLNHWIPTKCADPKGIKDYQRDGSWFGYADVNHTQPLSVDAMGERPIYYTSERDHIVHCASLWRRQYRAFAEGWRNVDSITASRMHTEHCAQYLIDMSDHGGKDFRTEPIEVEVAYAGCFVTD